MCRATSVSKRLSLLEKTFTDHRCEYLCVLTRARDAGHEAQSEDDQLRDNLWNGAVQSGRPDRCGHENGQTYLDEYYKTYSGVKRYMEEVPVRAAKDGYVTTILGRRRPVPDLNNPNKIAQQALDEWQSTLRLKAAPQIL